MLQLKNTARIEQLRVSVSWQRFMIPTFRELKYSVRDQSVNALTATSHDCMAFGTDRKGYELRTNLSKHNSDIFPYAGTFSPIGDAATCATQAKNSDLF